MIAPELADDVIRSTKGDMSEMKVLVAATRGQGSMVDDASWTPEGELPEHVLTLISHLDALPPGTVVGRTGWCGGVEVRLAA